LTISTVHRPFTIIILSPPPLPSALTPITVVFIYTERPDFGAVVVEEAT
jgi:hypothetical protein